MKKSEIILDMLESGATCNDISKAINCTIGTARSNVSRLRKRGHVIKCKKGIYRLIERSTAYESNVSKVRTILSTGDEWSVPEMMEITKAGVNTVRGSIQRLRNLGAVINKEYTRGEWFYTMTESDR